MAQRRDYIRGGFSIQMGSDPARMRRTGQVSRNQLSYGIVGHADSTPSYVQIRDGQPWVEVTMKPGGDEIVARVALPLAGKGAGWYLPISFGCRVILEMPNGNPQAAVIVGRLHDNNCSMPTSACGVDTGAGADEANAPAWAFQVLPDGQLLAIETGANGDILIHSGAAVEIKSGGTARIHLNGPTSLGEGPSSAPTGATVGPGGEDTPGTPAASHVPTPWSTPAPVPPATISPYAGQNDDGIVRAKELFQSHAAIDPGFWAKLEAIATNPLIAVGPMVSMTSVISSAGGKAGSKHTASD